jgi:IMP dehydrogenase
MNWETYTETSLLSCNDITLIPRKVSTLKHRSEADTSVEFCGVKLDVPFIGSPMPTVTNGRMAYRLAGFGALGIIHRFQTIEQQVKEFNLEAHENNFGGCAIGVTGDYQEHFLKLYDAGCRIFCLDTANGFNIQNKEVIEWIRNFQLGKKQFMSSDTLAPVDTLGQIYIIAGNVATAEGFQFLADLGVDAVRVGIGTGRICTTRDETGVFMPMISSLFECVTVRDASYPRVKIIADGGINTPADVCKELAIGADVVMCGGIFAGTKETPGKVRKIKGKLYKEYNGAASYATQVDFKDEDPDYVEGDETFVEYKGSVSKVVKRFKAGLQSSMSYMDAHNLSEFRENVEIGLL